MPLLSRQPLHLIVREDGPTTRILLGRRGSEIEITEHVTALSLEIWEGGARVLLDVPATAEIATGVAEAIERRPDPLEDLTAEELDQVIASAGASSSPGQRVLTHLQRRAATAR